MKIEIELTEEAAACIWSNNWGEKNNRPVQQIVQELAASEADDFRINYPNSIKSAVEAFRKANVQGEARASQISEPLETMPKTTATENTADGGLRSTDLLAVARNLHKTAHKACPFITHNSGPDGHSIVMRVKDYDESREVYESLMKFFSANVKENPTT